MPMSGWLEGAQADEQTLDGELNRGRWAMGGCSEFRGNGIMIRRELLAAVGGWQRRGAHRGRGPIEQDRGCRGRASCLGDRRGGLGGTRPDRLQSVAAAPSLGRRRLPTSVRTRAGRDEESQVDGRGTSGLRRVCRAARGSCRSRRRGGVGDGDGTTPRPRVNSCGLPGRKRATWLGCAALERGRRRQAYSSAGETPPDSARLALQRVLVGRRTASTPGSGAPSRPNPLREDGTHGAGEPRGSGRPRG